MLIAQTIHDFYQRNLFERIIVYLVLSALATKVIFEFVLGQWYFAQSQHMQWFFYAFLFIDYVVSYKKVINLRFTTNKNSLFAILLFIMVAQGLAVGYSLNNSTWTMFNDMVPLAMIALNILRMQSSAENAPPVDFKFLLNVVVIGSFVTCLIGYVSILQGKPASASIEYGQIFFPCFCAALFTVRPFPKVLFVLAVIAVLLSLEDLNRTTMIFLALIFMLFFIKTFIQQPTKAMLVVVGAVAVLGVAAMIIPKDSKTYVRVTDLASIDLSSRKGSVGERQAERDAIQLKLDNLGPTYDLFGMGLGGLYEVRFTHEYIYNYGHAHYAWSWFNLRFGKIGYIYLALMASLLLYNAIRNSLYKDQVGLFLSFLCLMALLFCLTYVNGVWLLSGLHFFNYKPKKLAEPEEAVDESLSLSR